MLLMLPLLALSQNDDIYAKYDIYRNPVRVFINKFSITFTTGYGSTNYQHDLSGVYFFQDANNQFIFSNTVDNMMVGPTIVGYSDWLNAPQPQANSPLDDIFDVPFDRLDNPVNNPLLNESFLLNTDSIGLGFEGAATSIPINLMIHYAYQKFRLGIGYTYERQWLKSLTPTTLRGEIRDYQPNFRSTRFTRLYGMLGYTFYSWWYWDFVAEVNVGRINPGPQFNRSAIDRGLYSNVGISFENNWSEYFRLIIRPSFDFKSYTVNLPDGASVKHSQPAFFLSVGISINIPEIPRSPMASDHTQLKHVYTDPKTGKRMEVRGQPIWKRQNPKMGENHRRPNQHQPSRKNKVKSKKRN